VKEAHKRERKAHWTTGSEQNMIQSKQRSFPKISRPNALHVLFNASV